MTTHRTFWHELAHAAHHHADVADFLPHDDRVLGSSGRVAHLSPLGFHHIHMLGRYHFNSDEQVARGELRPLRITEANVLNNP